MAFVVEIEVRKKDGSKYPSKTIDLLLAGLWRHMKEAGPSLPNFFDEKDPNFAGLRGARDTISRQLRQDGIGTAVKHADVLSYEEEALLWSKGLLEEAGVKVCLVCLGLIPQGLCSMLFWQSALSSWRQGAQGT